MAFNAFRTEPRMQCDNRVARRMKVKSVVSDGPLFGFDSRVRRGCLGCSGTQAGVKSSRPSL
jgi:hypothetical protein